MKYSIITVIIIRLLGGIAFAAPGDRVDPGNNAQWQLSAKGFIAKVIGAADDLSADWRAWETIDIMKGWLLVEAGQPLGEGGTGKIYKKGTYGRFL